MLFERHLRFFARAFVDGTQLPPSATNFRIVSEALGDERLLPTQAMELGPTGMIQRMAFMDSTGFQVIVSPESIYAQHVPAGGTPAAFVERAVGVLQRLLPLFPSRATRVAFIQEGEIEAKASTAALSLLRLPPSFVAKTPFEWDWRCAIKSARRFGEREEDTNTVASFRRFAGKLAWGEPFDGLVAELDINTVVENTAPRLHAADLEAFFKASLDWHEALTKELVDFLAGGVQA